MNHLKLLIKQKPLMYMGKKGSTIGQANSIRIVTTEPLPMKIDGEPVFVQAGEIVIDKKNQASMIVGSHSRPSSGQSICMYILILLLYILKSL